MYVARMCAERGERDLVHEEPLSPSVEEAEQRYIRSWREREAEFKRQIYLCSKLIASDERVIRAIPRCRCENIMLRPRRLQIRSRRVHTRW